MRHKEPGIRGTMHRMLVHQSHTETKKGKEKAVTSKWKHDEQCTESERERERERERQEVCVSVCVCVCVCVCQRERERSM